MTFLNVFKNNEAYAPGAKILHPVKIPLKIREDFSFVLSSVFCKKNCGT
jgi:hypothetical protein